MNRVTLEIYHQRRAEALKEQPAQRLRCSHCLQPPFSCYCKWLMPFDPQIHFAILMHPIEQRRRIATGRMSHLSLPNSRLIVGHNLSQNERLNELLDDPSYFCVMLYPGRRSVNISLLNEEARTAWIPKGKKLAVLVIDGTWATARQMVNQSSNLQNVARVGFTPPGPSMFRVRQQPRPECVSTIEAIHHCVELLGPACGFETLSRQHDGLMYVFDQMVRRQLELAHAHKRLTHVEIPEQAFPLPNASL